MARSLRSTPRVFSYQRFSRPEQATGDSFRRQGTTSFDVAKKLAKDRGLPFDESLSAGDQGLSAYTGAHRTKGVLGSFLAAVKRGDVPPGSILVVEEIDRLSRMEPVNAIDMIITGIIGKGISIVAGHTEYDAKSLQGGLIYVLIGKIQNAHDESKKKSERLAAAWSEKRKLARENGTPLTRMKPAWLTLDDGAYRAIPDAVKVIRSVFQWKLKGHSIRSIERKLNESAGWKPPVNEKRRTTGWRASYLKKILNDRSVIGEYQPHRKVNGKRIVDGEPIENYFPVIVKPEVFHAVQEQVVKNRRTGGPTGKVSNLFTSIATCGYCGGPMHFVDKGTDSNGREWKYLTCYNGSRHVKCERGNINYLEVEQLLLDNCPKLKPEQVLPNATEHAELVESLSLQIDGVRGRINDLERKIDNLVDQLADTADKALRERFVGRMQELEASKVEATQELREAEAQLRVADIDSRTLREWKQSLSDLKVALGEGGPDVRLATRQHFRQLVQSIECFTRGHAHLYDPKSREGDDIVERIEASIERIRMPKSLRAEFSDFATDLARRRMGKEGRFLRVRFITGAVVDLVPPGSLASGMVYGEGIEPGDRNVWRFVMPDLETQFAKFRAREGRNSSKGLPRTIPC